MIAFVTLFLVSYSVLGANPACFTKSETYGQDPTQGFNMTDYTELIASTIVTQDYRVNGVKICADSTSQLTGVQIQIGQRNTDNATWTNIITMGSLGVTDPCPQKQLLGVDTTNEITSLIVYYSSEQGVSQIDIVTANINVFAHSGLKAPTDLG